MGSLAEGGSYYEDHASTKALAGSVMCPTVASTSGYNGPPSDSKSVCSAGGTRSHVEHSRFNFLITLFPV